MGLTDSTSTLAAASTASLRALLEALAIRSEGMDDDAMRARITRHVEACSGVLVPIERLSLGTLLDLVEAAREPEAVPVKPEPICCPRCGGDLITAAWLDGRAHRANPADGQDEDGFWDPHADLAVTRLSCDDCGFGDEPHSAERLSELIAQRLVSADGTVQASAQRFRQAVRSAFAEWLGPWAPTPDDLAKLGHCS